MKKNTGTCTRRENLFSEMLKNRLTVFVALFICAAVFLVARLYVIIVADGSYYSESALLVWERERSIKAKRGIIYDRNGVSMADNKPVCSISVIYSQIEEPELVIKTLSQELGLSEEYVRARVEKRSSREKIKSNVDKDIGDRIRSLDMAGVMVDEDYKRYYPFDELASKTLGFTGADNQGIVGLEVYYNDILSGEDGSINTVTNARGIEIDGLSENRIEPTDGQNLVTTIDVNIQKYLEQAAIITMQKKNAKRVSIIAMNPANGEIYGMADVPGYNLNEPYTLNYDTAAEPTMDELNNMWRCTCISDTYEPGSTFKVATATSAFEEGLLKITDGFYCPGYKLVEDRRIRCHKTAGHGSETFRDGIVNSCNPVFMEVAARLGPEKFYANLEKLGLFEKTGIDMPGEAGSIFHKLDNVGPVELATMAFGQSFQITPLQLLRAFSAVVNGGNLVTPHFGLYTTDENNNIIEKLEYETITNVISRETSETMKSLLNDVVAEGTGNKAYVEGYSIGGKTATSEKLPRGTGKYIASFVGFAPVDNPKVIVLVLIDEPEGVYYGGTIAAPVAGEIFDNILPYLGVDKGVVENEQE